MKTINLWSFVSSFVCIGLFFLAIESQKIEDFMNNMFGIHPLLIVLIISLITFSFGFFGFSEVKNWKMLLISILTVILTLGLSTITGVLLLFWTFLDLV